MASGLVCCGKTLESDREKSQRLVSKRTKDTILKPRDGSVRRAPGMSLRGFARQPLRALMKRWPS